LLLDIIFLRSQKSDVAEADGDVIYAWLIDSIQARDSGAHCDRDDALLFHPSELPLFRLAMSEVLGVDSYQVYRYFISRRQFGTFVLNMNSLFAQLSVCASMHLRAHATKVYGVSVITPLPIADECTVLAAAARSRLQVFPSATTK
jgi:hypothetical protein